jgi:predicted DNA-binding WGR domain protein
MVLPVCPAEHARTPDEPPATFGFLRSRGFAVRLGACSGRFDGLMGRHMPRYEFVEGSSSKFWDIQLDGTSFYTTYGKIGTDGQTSMKEFDSEAKARKEYDKLIGEKVKKGYLLVGGAGPATEVEEEEDDVDTVVSAPPVVKAAPKKAAPPVVEDEDDDDDDGEANGARYFEFSEGTSNKFWEIRLEGTAVMTRYGKIGADGQETMKEFDSDAKAKKEYDKLVGEKTKKGYVERTTS